jgi:hypothetical protein
MEKCRTTPEVYGFEVVLKQAIFLSWPEFLAKLRLLFFWVIVSTLLITDTELNAFAAPANLHVEVVPCPLAGIRV